MKMSFLEVEIWIGVIRLGTALMVMLKCLSVDGGRAGLGGCRFEMGTELEECMRRMRTCLRLFGL